MWLVSLLLIIPFTPENRYDTAVLNIVFNASNGEYSNYVIFYNGNMISRLKRDDIWGTIRYLDVSEIRVMDWRYHRDMEHLSIDKYNGRYMLMWEDPLGHRTPGPKRVIVDNVSVYVGEDIEVENRKTLPVEKRILIR